MLIRVTTDEGLQVEIPGQDPAGEELEAYVQHYRDWKPGEAGSMSWRHPDGGWVVVPMHRVVAIEAIPEQEAEG